MKTKIRKTYNFIIRAVIILLTFGFIYKEVFHTHDFESIIDSFTNIFSERSFYTNLSLIIILMFINWGVETFKWQFLIRKIEKVTFFKAYEAVLSGVAVSSFTPNRIGDYFGRVFILEKANRIEGILITLIGSISQFFVMTFTGTIALAIIVIQFKTELISYLEVSEKMFFMLYGALGIIATLIFTFLILLFLNVSVITDFTNYLLKDRFRKLKNYLKVFKFYNASEILKVLGLSFLRYLIFSIQFYILLRMFMIPIPFFQGFVIITLIFLIMTFLPTIAIVELGIRGSVSLYFFGLFFAKAGIQSIDHELGTLAASSTLWLINIAVPALMGAIFVFNLKFFRKND